jgi:hypothetical protein
MLSEPTKIEFCNTGTEPHVIFVEPLPDDFTLLPNEKLEVHAWANGASAEFSLNVAGWATAVYISPDNARYQVVQNGVTLEPAHNRQAALDAGYRV